MLSNIRSICTSNRRKIFSEKLTIKAGGAFKNFPRLFHDLLYWTLFAEAFFIDMKNHRLKLSFQTPFGIIEKKHGENSRPLCMKPEEVGTDLSPGSAKLN